jgi:hypothetical protein
VWTVRIGGGYFQTLGIGVIGRNLETQDATDVVINQIVADRYFAGTEAIGRRIRLQSAGPTTSNPWLTIVGIVAAIPQRDLPDADPVVYLPWRPVVPTTASLVIRGSANPLSMAPDVRGLDADLAVYRVLTLEQAVDQGRWNSRMSTILIALITTVSVGLCAVGLYAVTSRAVAERTREMGIRLALGAPRTRLNWLVARRTLRQIAVGLLFGIGAATLWQIAFGAAAGLVQPTSLALAAGAMLTVGAASCWVPLRRLSRLSPLDVLRDE